MDVIVGAKKVSPPEAGAGVVSDSDSESHFEDARRCGQGPGAVGRGSLFTGHLERSETELSREGSVFNAFLIIKGLHSLISTPQFKKKSTNTHPLQRVLSDFLYRLGTPGQARPRKDC